MVAVRRSCRDLVTGDGARVLSGGCGGYRLAKTVAFLDAMDHDGIYLGHWLDVGLFGLWWLYSTSGIGMLA